MLVMLFASCELIVTTSSAVTCDGASGKSQPTAAARQAARTNGRPAARRALPAARRALPAALRALTAPRTAPHVVDAKCRNRLRTETESIAVRPFAVLRRRRRPENPTPDDRRRPQATDLSTSVSASSESDA